MMVLKIAAGWLGIATVVALCLGRTIASCGKQDEKAHPESVPERARRAGL